MLQKQKSDFKRTFVISLVIVVPLVVVSLLMNGGGSHEPAASATPEPTATAFVDPLKALCDDPSYLSRWAEPENAPTKPRPWTVTVFPCVPIRSEYGASADDEKYFDAIANIQKELPDANRAEGGQPPDIVACWNVIPVANVIETCTGYSSGLTVERVRLSYQIILLNAATGQSIKSFSVTGSLPDECQDSYLVYQGQTSVSVSGDEPSIGQSIGQISNTLERYLNAP